MPKCLKIVGACLLLAMLTAIAPLKANAQNCNHSYQTAKDGSNCGGRAADQRPGGRP